MEEDIKKRYNWSIEQGDYEISYKSSQTYLRKQKRKRLIINIFKAVSIISTILLIVFISIA